MKKLVFGKMFFLQIQVYDFSESRRESYVWESGSIKFYHALILFPIFSRRTKKADAFTSRLLDIHAKMLDMNKQEVLLQHVFS